MAEPEASTQKPETNITVTINERLKHSNVIKIILINKRGKPVTIEQQSTSEAADATVLICI